MLKINLKYLKSTTTCHRFQSGRREDGSLITLYLKKADLAAAGIDHTKGITVTVKEAEA